MGQKHTRKDHVRGFRGQTGVPLPREKKGKPKKNEEQFFGNQPDREVVVFLNA
jgi:hypothetical protein